MICPARDCLPNGAKARGVDVNYFNFSTSGNFHVVLSKNTLVGA
jgi:hypothetical protein